MRTVNSKERVFLATGSIARKRHDASDRSQAIESLA